jgi:alanyl-tRNA synthetase
VLQDKHDNYATDLFTPIFDAIAGLTGLKYTGRFPATNQADPVAEAADAQLRHDIAFRVVADHIRCLTFALTDGAVPSNEGRGYVLRRILRRAVRFGRQHLNLGEPFMHKLVPAVVDAMGETFPELRKNPARVAELIVDEETSFGRTLDRGIQLFDDAAKAGSVSAADAFKLHDTYGFPIDLTRIMAEERGLKVDVAGYEVLMEEAKERARSGGKADAERVHDLTPDALAQLAGLGIGPTDDQPKYSHEPVQATVVAIWNGASLDPAVVAATGATAVAGEEIAVLLDRTNFYAEMGGQVGDSGQLRAGEAVFDVRSTRVVGGYVMHVGQIRSGRIAVRDHVTATVSASRALTEKNHTSTHVANWALREVLGDGVQQKGSLVDPEKLRFDFSHGKALADEELARVETLVNDAIGKKLPVYAETAPQELALKIHGLRAVFGEKYPPMVRVVSIGVPVKELLADPGNEKWRQYSVEFCGGTHLASIADAEEFAVTAEESVSKGIRRIVAVTGDAARSAVAAAKVVDEQIAHGRRCGESEIAPILASLQKAIAGGQLPLRAKRRAQAAVAELQARQKAFEKASKTESGGGAADAIAVAGELLAGAVSLGGGKIIVGEIPGAGDEQLRAAVDWLKKKSASHGIFLAAGAGEKVSFVAAVSDDLIGKGLKAGDWAKDAAKTAGGSGGGRPQMAQAGAKDPSKIPAALEAARKFATAALPS